VGMKSTWYRRLGDRRGRLRFELVGELAAVFGTVDALTARDVSWRGASVESPVPLPLDSVQSLRFVMGDQVGEVTVRVRHVTRTDCPGGERYRIGFEFLDLQPEMREEIGRLVAADSQSSSDM
jgi:PilZ domain-containing protein